MIPAQAVDAAAKAIYEGEGDLWPEGTDTAHSFARKDAQLALEAAAPHMLAPLLTLADERDKVHGTIRGHITAHELRTLLNNNEGENK